MLLFADITFDSYGHQAGLGDISRQIMYGNTGKGGEYAEFIMIKCIISRMQEPGCKENYPLAIVIGSNLLSLLIYVISAIILFWFGIIWVIGYVIFILVLEFRLLSRHCVDCYYYGKTCAFGKGRLSALFFRKGSPEKFIHRKLTWKDIVPDFLTFIVPVIAGILLLVQEFTWTVLILVIALLILGFAGNALVRGQLACRFCKQREIGCPAEQLFGKTKP